VPTYEFECEDGHKFERVLRLVDLMKAQLCKCGALAAQVIRTAPAMVGFDSASARVDEATYREHNVTREESDGVITKAPVAPSDQCKCGNCSRHRRRVPITAVAQPGKAV
jgi:putative FmdB family regulatory protein